MKDDTKTILHILKKKYIILGIIGAIIISFAGWWAYDNFSSRPLGKKLEYVGKTNYGCYVFCDSKPGSTYYYATDMTLEEIGSHFSKASLKQKNDSDSFHAYTSLWLVTPDGSFDVYYYASADMLPKGIASKDTQASHFISLTASKYSLAKDSL